MPKVISIPSNIEKIGRELDARGYEVVHENYEGHVDAMLYDSSKSSLGYLSDYNNVIDMDRGASVIDTKDKGIGQIIYAIEHSTKEDLF
ncbi:YkuS family protein [Lutibacter sp. B2]|nr:YkuS family protein [Lutibacter sp. B2]